MSNIIFANLFIIFVLVNKRMCRIWTQFATIVFIHPLKIPITPQRSRDQVFGIYETRVGYRYCFCKDTVDVATVAMKLGCKPVNGAAFGFGVEHFPYPLSYFHSFCSHTETTMTLRDTKKICGLKFIPSANLSVGIGPS